jgi:hypothetical protein
LFHEEKEEEVMGVVVGMQVFSVFSGLGVGGYGIFCLPSGCGDASFSMFSG